MNKRIAALIGATTIAATSLLGVGTADAATKKVKHYKSCSALHKDYPHGIAKRGAVDTPKPGYHRVKNFRTNGAVYTANKGLDKDHDKIACEGIGTKLPPPPPKPAHNVVGRDTLHFPNGVSITARLLGSEAIQDTAVNGVGMGAVYEFLFSNGGTAAYDPSDSIISALYGPTGIPAPEVFDSANGLDADGDFYAVPIPPGSSETLRYEFRMPWGGDPSQVLLSVDASYLTSDPAVFYYAS
jgi:hypothetical protein